MMNPKDPNSWDTLADHPVFLGGAFDPAWYQGDARKDLSRLRSLAIRILRELPLMTCELVVLDDCTMYVESKIEESTVASVYPAILDNYEPCYFVDLVGCTKEIRVTDLDEVMSILHTQFAKLEDEKGTF